MAWRWRFQSFLLLWNAPHGHGHGHGHGHCLSMLTTTTTTTTTTTAPCRFKSSSRKTHSLTKYLRKECGFSRCAVMTMRRKDVRPWNAEGSDAVDVAMRVVDTLRRHGFSDADVRRLVSHVPSVLLIGTDDHARRCRTLAQAVDDLTDLGDADGNARFSKIVQRTQEALGPERVLRNLRSLQRVFKNEQELCSAVRRHCRLLRCNQEHVDRRVRLFEEFGLEHHDVQSLFHAVPIALTRPSEFIRQLYDLLRDMGFAVSSATLRRGFEQTFCYRPEKLQHKEQELAGFGLAQEEIQELTRKCPCILGISSEKIKNIMTYLVHSACLPPNVVVSYPKLLCLRLEKNIIPRHMFYNFLREHQLFKRIPHLAPFLNMSEKAMLKTYMNGNDKLIGFYELIMEKGRNGAQ